MKDIFFKQKPGYITAWVALLPLNHQLVSSFVCFKHKLNDYVQRYYFPILANANTKHMNAFRSSLGFQTAMYITLEIKSYCHLCECKGIRVYECVLSSEDTHLSVPTWKPTMEFWRKHNKYW